MRLFNKLVGLIVTSLVLVVAGLAINKWRETAPELIDLSLDNYREQLARAREILTPGPLRGSFVETAQPITTAGVLAETNRHRTAANLLPLTGNTILNNAAKNKLDDMFAQQYFEHVSPQGLGPADVVDAVGYQYIRVGENLALGNFAGDVDLVQAWMDSPGHRENILHAGYTELGVAAASGLYQGQQTWLAVQTFAKPLTDCPNIDPLLQEKIEQQQEQLNNLQQNLTNQQELINNEQAALIALAEEAAQLTKQGNEQIEQGNRIAQKEGNEAAQPYWDKGQALHDQAKQKQNEFNSRQQELMQQVDSFNNQVKQQQKQQENLRELVDQINKQIKAFNACLQ